jgi:hypothetical protein
VALVDQAGDPGAIVRYATARGLLGREVPDAPRTSGIRPR